jgi:hypothetical protein
VLVAGVFSLEDGPSFKLTIGPLPQPFLKTAAQWFDGALVSAGQEAVNIRGLQVSPLLEA